VSDNEKRTGVYMNKIAVAIAFLFIATGAYAQERKSIKDIDKELKQIKSTATAMELIRAIGETEPQTDEDVRIMGELMDKYPVEGQKAAMLIKDPKLTGAVMKECAREVARIRKVRASAHTIKHRWKRCLMVWAEERQ